MSPFLTTLGGGSARGFGRAFRRSGPTTAAPGQQLYDSGGTYSFVVPDGITSISVICVGGGGGGSFWGNQADYGQPPVEAYGALSGNGGGGGALAYTNNIVVTPGATVTIDVGFPGYAGDSGARSRAVYNGTTVVEAGGGLSGANGRTGGAVIVGTGGSGGAGGLEGTGKTYQRPGGGQAIFGGGGGGGAGGYAGNGGNGGNAANSNPYNNGTAGAAGAGGGAGGGGGGGGSTTIINNGGEGSEFRVHQGGYGGGVGVLGVGSSGAAGTAGLQGTGGNGADGSGNNFGAGGAGGYVYWITPAGTYTPVGGETAGTTGAVRIIWGPARSYPSNAASV